MTTPTPELEPANPPERRRLRLLAILGLATVALVAIAGTVAAIWMRAGSGSDDAGGVVPPGWRETTVASGAYSYAHDGAWLAVDDAVEFDAALAGPDTGAEPAPKSDGLWKTPGFSDSTGTIFRVSSSTFPGEPPSAKVAVDSYVARIRAVLGGPPNSVEHSSPYAGPQGYEGWYEWYFVGDNPYFAMATIGIVQGDTVVFVFALSLDETDVWEAAVKDLAGSVAINAEPTTPRDEQGYRGAPISTSDVAASGKSLQVDSAGTIAYEYPWDWYRAFPPTDKPNPLSSPFDRRTTGWAGSWYVVEPADAEPTPDFLIAQELEPGGTAFASIDDAQAAAIAGAETNTGGATADETKTFTTALGLDARLTVLHWASDESPTAETVIVTAGRGERFVVFQWVGTSGPVDQTSLLELVDTLRVDA